MRIGALALAALVLLSASAPGVRSTVAPDASRAIAWLKTQQHADGSFDLAPYVVEAIASAGLDPKTWPSEAKNAWASLPTYASTYGGLYADERVLHAAGQSGYDPASVDGKDRV